MVFGALKAPSGYIDNESFLKVLSIVVKGSLDQKIECECGFLDFTLYGTPVLMPK